MSMHEHSALVLIDMQCCMSDPARPSRNNLQAEDNIERLLVAWRTADRPVIHVRHLSINPKSGFWPGQQGAAFQQRFAPRQREHVSDKHVTDAFAGSGLERHLRVRSIAELLVVGVSTNYSVEATVRSAGCLGFITTVVSDACFTFARANLEGRMCTADEIHLMSLSNLDGEYAAVRTTDAVLVASKLSL